MTLSTVTPRTNPVATSRLEPTANSIDEQELTLQPTHQDPCLIEAADQSMAVRLDNQTSAKRQAKPFMFEVTRPYSTDSSTTYVPFLVDGLFKQGGLSSIVAKPKQGKSSLARSLAVCVSKGLPFLGRNSKQGEVLLISIEDPDHDVNICLRVLEYSETEGVLDSRIHPIYRVDAKGEDNINALGMALSQYPKVRLVVIDTLAKFVRVKDVNEYSQWLPVFQHLRSVMAEHPLVSVVCLLHAKKVTADDPFDSMLGSVALRGEFDTSIAIYKDGQQRMILSETRMGRAMEPTVLLAESETVCGCQVVRSFSLGKSSDQLDADKIESSQTKRKETLEDRVIAHLTQFPNQSRTYNSVREEVTGRDQEVIRAIQNLIAEGVITESGTRNSPVNPLMLTLDRANLKLRDFIGTSKQAIN